jgi:hypothetical protein
MSRTMVAKMRTAEKARYLLFSIADLKQLAVFLTTGINISLEGG